VSGALPNNLVTESLVDEPALRDGHAEADPARDLLMMAVIERHMASGAVGKGFVRGIGIKQGAPASSVAHDHHNLAVIGADDDPLMAMSFLALEVILSLKLTDKGLMDVDRFERIPLWID